MTSPHNLLALLDELEKKECGCDYYEYCGNCIEKANAFPLLSQKLRESVEALENINAHKFEDAEFATETTRRLMAGGQVMKLMYIAHKALLSINSNLPQ